MYLSWMKIFLSLYGRDRRFLRTPPFWFSFVFISTLSFFWTLLSWNFKPLYKITARVLYFFVYIFVHVVVTIIHFCMWIWNCTWFECILFFELISVYMVWVCTGIFGEKVLQMIWVYTAILILGVYQCWCLIGLRSKSSIVCALEGTLEFSSGVRWTGVHCSQWTWAWGVYTLSGVY